MVRGSSFWIVSLWLVTLFLLISSLFVECSPVEFGLPVIDNYKYVRIGIGLLFIAVAAVPVFIINTLASKSALNSSITLALFFIIALSNVNSVYFNYSHISLLLYAWGLFYNIKGDNFKEMLLVTTAALYTPELMWAVPILAVINTIGKSDGVRAFIINICGALAPVLYMLSYRHLLYKDSVEYIGEYAQQMMDIYSPVLSVSFANIFLVGVFAIIIMHTFINFLHKNSQNNIATGELLRLELFNAIILLVLYLLFWGNVNANLNIIMAAPLSVLLSNLYTTNLKRPFFKIELIIFICALILSRLDYFL